MKINSAAELDRASAFAHQLLSRGPINWECKRWRKTRSNEQNALLWVMYAPIAEAMGFDRDYLHEWFCGRMWGWKDIRVPKTPRNPEGLASVPVRSTTRDEQGKRNVIDAKEFARFVDMVDRIASQAGVFIPAREAA